MFDLARWQNECNRCTCLSGGVVKCSRDQCAKKCKDEQGYTHQVTMIRSNIPMKSLDRLETPGARSATTVASALQAGWWNALGSLAGAKTSKDTPTKWATSGPTSARAAPADQGEKSPAGRAAARTPAQMSVDLSIR